MGMGMEMEMAMEKGMRTDMVMVMEMGQEIRTRAEHVLFSMFEYQMFVNHFRPVCLAFLSRDYNL